MSAYEDIDVSTVASAEKSPADTPCAGNPITLAAVIVPVTVLLGLVHAGVPAGPLPRFVHKNTMTAPVSRALAKWMWDCATAEVKPETGAKVPPSSLRTIVGSTDPVDQLIGGNYCDICNPFSYSKSIMGNQTQRSAHIKDAIDFFNALENGTLPAVAYVKPDSLVDGHPASSKLDLFEAMLENILDQLKKRNRLSDTALFVTFDEGGGYYDSGFIQPIDFFGDGPRIPLIVVSKYSTGGNIVHSYNDHASIVKFIERNRNLKPLTNRSRDNLPNPNMDPNHPYVPLNMPAVGDSFDMFNFN